MAKLRSMSANVEEYHGYVTLENDTKVNVHGLLLRSYNSVVAIYEFIGGVLYLLPRYDYSNTTMKYVNAFIDDFTSLERVGYVKNA